jgi:hypothetical protein
MEALRSMGKQTLHEGCPYVNNCEVCGRRLSGNAWKYCDRCREAGQRQAKRQRDKEEKAFYRDRKREEDNFYHFLYYHRLTEPKLKPLLDHSEIIQEEYACLDDFHQDDFHQDAVVKIDGIKWLIIQPPDDLPSAADTAKKKLRKLLTFLVNHPWDSRHASTRCQLILAIKELERDIGQWHSTKAIIRISGRAKAIQELMFEANDLPGFIHALLAHVEIQRIKYFATGQRQFLARARSWLAGAEFVCERALNRPAWKHNEIVSYLRFYIDAVKVRLAFDEGEGEDDTAPPIFSMSRPSGALTGDNFLAFQLCFAEGANLLRDRRQSRPAGISPYAVGAATLTGYSEGQTCASPRG